MKIGDKVRFLNEIGEGKVVAFRGKDIAVVEDADGFEIPMATTDLVVVETDNYNVPTPMQKEEKKRRQQQDTASSLTTATNARRDTGRPAFIEEELPASYQAEIRGADRLNAMLAFVPQNIKQFSITPFESYLVNDSNYYLYYSILTQEGGLWMLRAHGYIEPNTKLLLEEFDRTQLNSLEHMAVQLTAFKDKKKFIKKPVVDTELHVDTKKFFRLNAFGESDFFNTPSMMLDIVRDDKTIHEDKISPEVLQQAMQEKNEAAKSAAPKPQSKGKQEKNSLLEIDLHINSLLDNTHGLSNNDMLRYQLDKFNEVMEANKKKQGQRIVFIHGKGEGILRNAILSELKKKYPSCTYQDASFQEYGFGATLVTIK